MAGEDGEIRTLPLIAREMKQQSFKKYGDVIKLGTPTLELTDDEHPYYRIEIKEFEPKGEYVTELRCTFNNFLILIPLEKVEYFLAVGPVVDKLRSRPFPGTNEVEAFYSDAQEGFMLKPGVWFQFPFVNKTSRWLEITKLAGNNAKIKEQETRNYEEILKVRFKLETPHADDSPRLI